MPLTDRQKEVIAACARVIGQNGGLNYYGLVRDLCVLKVSSNDKAGERVSKLLGYVGNKYGLPHRFIGEIVYEAVAREEVGINITLPVPLKPELTDRERHVLEATTIVLIPKGGHFNGYLNNVAELVGINKKKIYDTIEDLKHKFSTATIEGAILSALASGILEPGKLFGNQLPKPLVVIMNSESYRRAVQYTATGVFARKLTGLEKEVSVSSVEGIGLNGGLFWLGLIKEVAAKTGKSQDSVERVVMNLTQKFHTHYRGVAFYAASRLLNEPVVITLPQRVDAEFDSLELKVMLESAKVIIPACGYYMGFREDIASRTNFSKGYLGLIWWGILKKTKTKNLGQAVTYFIAHGLIEVDQRRLDPARMPALEAILKATRKSTSH